MAVFRLKLPPSNNQLVMPVILKGRRGPTGKPVCRLVPTKAAKEYREYIHSKLPVMPVGGVLEFYVTVYVPSLASDGLNRIKALEDGINERLWYDDKQIAEWHIRKVVTSDPHQVGVVIEVRPAEVGEHPEMAKRLAVSSIADRENAAAQPELEFEMESQQLAYAPPVAEKLRQLAQPASYPAQVDDEEQPPPGWGGAA